MDKIEVLVVDDNHVFRNAISELLETESSILVVDEAMDGNEAVEKVVTKKPSIVIMDISMPNMDGIEATKLILKSNSKVKILALSIHKGKRFVKSMLNAGASGYLLKDNAADELIRAIKKIAHGDIYLDSAITSIVLNKTEETPKNSTVLQTKLHRPPVTDDVLIRSRIIQTFESKKELPFSLISAPAGFGKSMAVSQWLDQTDNLYAWVSLDDDHNDLRTFLNYLKSAIEKIFPNVLEELSSYLSGGILPPIKILSYAVINDLDTIQQNFILAFDDYHKITNQQIHEFVSMLLTYPPEHMHFCMITRIDPPLNLNKLMANNRMHEVRMSDLSFTNDEISELFLKLNKNDLNPEMAQAFFNRTEGWIVSLRMAFLNVQKSEDVAKVLNALKGDSYSLSFYLLEEVLKKQPKEIQNKLLKTAVLNRFNGDLIDAIIDTDSAEENKLTGHQFIEWLIKGNLFIIPLDDERKWFRFHHLIQELLKNWLKKDLGEDQIKEIHENAGSWFAEHQFIEEAIAHKLKASNPKGACEIIEKNRMTELENDNWVTVQKWLQLVPESHRANSPNILLAEAWVAYQNFQLEKMDVILKQVFSILDTEAKNEEALGEAHLLSGMLIVLVGNGVLALDHLDKADHFLPTNYKLITGTLYLHQALGRSMIGQKEEALVKLKQQIAVNHKSPIYVTRLLGGLFYVNQFAAHLPCAIEGAKRAQNASRKYDMVYTNAMSACLEGTALFSAFKLEEALKIFEQVVEYRFSLHVGTALDAIAAKTITHQLLQQPAEADKSLKLLEDFEKVNSTSGNLVITSSCSARLSLMRGEISSAVAWEKSVQEKPCFANTFVWVEVPMLTQIRVLLVKNKEDSLVKASSLLDEFLKVTQSHHLYNQVIEAKVLKTVMFQKQNKTEEALKVLEDAVLLAKPGQYIRPFIEIGIEMKALLKKLPKNELIQGFINELLECYPSQNNSNQAVINKFQLNSKGDFKSLITIRETEIIQMLAKGLRNKEIADTIFVAEGTVKKHIYNICQKWNVNSRIHLLKIARELGLIEKK